MELISGLSIKGFRSIRDVEIAKIGSLAAFVGRNSSGKSNILKALNLFFNDRVEGTQPLELLRDFNKYDAIVRKRKRRLEVGVTFTLPDTFRFRKGLEAVRDLVEGTSFTITKIWEQDTPTAFRLNGKALAVDDQQKIAQFLALINFRYIPNRVLPLDIIREEQIALSRVILKRLTLNRQQNDAALDDIRTQSTQIAKRISDIFAESSPDTKEVQLAVPENWSEILFQMGFKIVSKLNDHVITDETVEGSGNQSLLMLETLRLIDVDYSTYFGWRQATIWAFEEPESSLHYSLEALIAARLANYASEPKERLQVLITTHSSLFMQHASTPILVSKDKGETTVERISDVRQRAPEIARAGVMRWEHPLLVYPRHCLVLVEGKYDFDVIERVRSTLVAADRVVVSYLERMEAREGATGGVQNLRDYILDNISAVRARFEEAPVVALFDWDAEAPASGLAAKVKGTAGLYVESWPKSDLNPDLGTDFAGIERALGTDVIRQAATDSKVTLFEREGKLALHPKDRQ
jgi:predicted ATP-dependent endonuclease of OLD family